MKVFFKIISYLVFLIAIFNILMSLYSKYTEGADPCKDTITYDEVFKEMLHQRGWNMIENPNYNCLAYRTTDSLYHKHTSDRGKVLLNINKEAFSYGWLYSQLIQNNRAGLKIMADSFLTIAGKDGLSRKQLAELIVTFVQDIPYSYVLSESCDDIDTEGRPCIGNIPFGIVSPYEFLHHEMGDCDTRSVLIFTLLDIVGFQPMIVLSKEYAHAMIALNIPSAGDYITYNNQKYYFWETTDKGWPLGMLPPSTNNVDYWKMSIVKNEL